MGCVILFVLYISLFHLFFAAAECMSHPVEFISSLLPQNVVWALFVTVSKAIPASCNHDRVDVISQRNNMRLHHVVIANIAISLGAQQLMHFACSTLIFANLEVPSDRPSRNSSVCFWLSIPILSFCLIEVICTCFFADFFFSDLFSLKPFHSAACVSRRRVSCPSLAQGNDFLGGKDCVLVVRGRLITLDARDALAHASQSCHLACENMPPFSFLISPLTMFLNPTPCALHFYHVPT